jgi:dTDP-glucose 4,6-dehydratase
VARLILKLVGKPESLLTTVKDRPGHDRRYALDTRKVRRELAWEPSVRFEDGMAATVAWYRANLEWVRRVKSGEYQKYYEMHYGARESGIANQESRITNHESRRT